MGASNYLIEEQVKYLPDGKLIWIKCRKKSQLGTECGYLSSKGYRYMKVGFQRKAVHHVIWYLHYKQWPNPDMDIDHINRNKLDNRIENLRQVPRAINSLNNGATNVTTNGNNYRVRIAGSYYGGGFKTKEEATIFAKNKKEEILKERFEGELWRPTNVS